MKLKGGFVVKKFCETEVAESDPLQEESLDLNFKVYDKDLLKGYNQGCELLGMSESEISGFVGEREIGGITINGFSGRKTGIYNIVINGFEFKGNKFTSFDVRYVKNIGNIIILRLRIPYQEKFHEQYPRFIHDTIDIEISEANEQLKIPDTKKDPDGE